MKLAKKFISIMTKNQIVIHNPFLSQFLRIPINFNLSILIITDTHNSLNEKDLPTTFNHDVCFLLGDLSNDDIAIVNHYVKPFMPVYGILGNHDNFSNLENNDIPNIHGKVVLINGIKVAGLQGSVRYKNSESPMYNDTESITIADNIENADIFITHDSIKYAYTKADLKHSNDTFSSPHSGLKGITTYCLKHNIPLHIHGHHHTNDFKVLPNGTLSICCYKCVEINTSIL